MPGSGWAVHGVHLVELSVVYLVPGCHCEVARCEYVHGTV